MRAAEFIVENSQLNVLYDPARQAAAIDYLTDYYDSEGQARQILNAYTTTVDKLIAHGGTVYRALWVEPGRKPNLTNPGDHWTLSPELAKEYLDSEAGQYARMDMDSDDEPHPYIISATVGPNGITNNGVNFAEQHREQEVRLVNPRAAKFEIVNQHDGNIMMRADGTPVINDPWVV